MVVETQNQTGSAFWRRSGSRLLDRLTLLLSVLGVFLGLAGFGYVPVLTAIVLFVAVLLLALVISAPARLPISSPPERTRPTTSATMLCATLPTHCPIPA